MQRSGGNGVLLFLPPSPVLPSVTAHRQNQLPCSNLRILGFSQSLPPSSGTVSMWRSSARSELLAAKPGEGDRRGLPPSTPGNRRQPATCSLSQTFKAGNASERELVQLQNRLLKEGRLGRQGASKRRWRRARARLQLRPRPLIWHIMPHAVTHFLVLLCPV